MLLKPVKDLFSPDRALKPFLASEWHNQKNVKLLCSTDRATIGWFTLLARSALRM
jgi:hypothetical protein